MTESVWIFYRQTQVNPAAVDQNHAIPSTSLIGRLTSGVAEMVKPAGLEAVYLYQPIDYEHPAFADGPAPDAVLRLVLAQTEALGDWLGTDSFEQLLLSEPAGYCQPSAAVYADAHAARLAVSTSGNQDQSVAEQVSFLVRYFAPISAEAQFQQAYIRSHVPILARFPAIRGVYAGLPVDHMTPSRSPFATSEIRLLNEVVFDDVSALDQALASPVMDALRQDSARLPPCAGNAHHAMRRQTLFLKPVSDPAG